MDSNSERPPPNPTIRRKRRNRRIAVYGGLVAGLVSLYFYQPQRLNFFPRKPPANPPKADANAKLLFSPGVRIALIQAHPDDSEFFVGPLLLRLASSGAEIHQLVMTDGDKGYYFWAQQEAAANRRVRMAEQNEAARNYAKDVTFLHLPDGRLGGQSGNAERVREFLLRVKPDYVLAFDTEYWPRVNHADHLASGQAAWEAVMTPPGIAGIKDLLLYDTTAPNFVPDVSDWIDRASQMLAIHKSQFYGERLERVRNMVLNGWYEAGQRAGEQFGVPLRVVKL